MVENFDRIVEEILKPPSNLEDYLVRLEKHAKRMVEETKNEKLKYGYEGWLSCIYWIRKWAKELGVDLKKVGKQKLKEVL